MASALNLQATLVLFILKHLDFSFFLRLFLPNFIEVR